MSVHGGKMKLLLGDFSGSNIPSFSPIFVVNYFRNPEGVSDRQYSYKSSLHLPHCYEFVTEML